MKHTKGKWLVKSYVFDGTKAKSYYEIETDNGKCIASCDIDFRIEEESEANAKLIAAAPDMLKILQQFIHSVEHEGVIEGRVVDAVRNAEDAIKKATL